MIEKYLKQTEFASQSDFMANFKVNVPENFNFGYDVVDSWAESDPEKNALCWCNDKGEHIDFTFADIKRESDKAASWFLELGIGHGDMVMLVLKRRYEFWFSIIALHKIGAVAIPATHLLTEKDIIFRCNAADIKMVVTVGDEVVTTHVDKAIEQCPTLRHRVTVGENQPSGWLSYWEGVGSAAPFKRAEQSSSNDDISLLYFTSGTTGNPKMVAHDFTYPLAHIITASYWHNLTPESLHLTLADTGWGKAVWGKLYGQWIAGANVFVYDFDKFEPSDVLTMIEKYGITSFCAPPTVFRFLIREDLAQFDISTLNYCTIAGEALNPIVYEEFYRKTGVKLMEGFGQTETTLTLATYPWVEPKPGSMGIPNPQYDVALLTSDGRWAEDGEQGQIVIKCDAAHPLGLFKEYYRDAAMTAQVYRNGLYFTGDVAWRDKDGYYWFVGRADDVIKSSGYRIGPFEVESALMTHPSVVECAITGVPDPVRGQVVKATIVLGESYRNHDKAALTKEIQDHVKRVTAPYKYPRIVEFVDELPKTISGKIRRVEIRDQKS